MESSFLDESGSSFRQGSSTTDEASRDEVQESKVRAEMVVSFIIPA
jgi:hypothetical protein